MHYDNGNWGPDNINRVFAHETCHIFGAADEYGSCGCGASGFLQVANNNYRTHRTGRALCPKPRVRGDKPQGSTVPHQICDLMVPVGCAPQAPTTSVEECVCASLLDNAL